MRKNKYKLYASEGLSDRRQHNMCLCHLDGKMFKKIWGIPAIPIPTTNKVGNRFVLPGNGAFSEQRKKIFI